MDKECLIKMVNEIGNQPNIDRIFSRLGSTQFRSLAELSRNAECIDEILLLIEYKIAKGNGWDFILNGEVFGQVIIEKLQEIKNSNTDSRTTLNNISEFFGYMHWKMTVVKDKYKTSRNK
jgi:hypothetical protein